jgi:hypothetical protein
VACAMPPAINTDRGTNLRRIQPRWETILVRREREDIGEVIGFL